MSFIDIATLSMHRRNEMEARIKTFEEKCDHAIDDINRLRMQAQGFINHLNCGAVELKDRFLSCMKQLDEYMYVMTDFNLILANLELKESEDPPIHDYSTLLKPLPPDNLNLIDTLSEPMPSTSKQEAVSSKKSKEKEGKRKIAKEQVLISFSSNSCSVESIAMKTEMQTPNTNLAENVEQLNLEDCTIEKDECNMPAQSILEIDHVYQASIMNIDGMSFWIVPGDLKELINLLNKMTDFYKENQVDVTLDELMNFTCCAVFDTKTELFYRALYIRLSEEDMSVAELFLVDTGDTQLVPVAFIQPLEPLFCQSPPFARCCHLAGIELHVTGQEDEMYSKQQLLLKEFLEKPCMMRIEDNSSEALEVTLLHASGVSLNDLLVRNGCATKLSEERTRSIKNEDCKGLAELDAANFSIDDCLEHDDPVEAIMGYKNRDEIDICKHYKGGPDKTCFKGAKCTKRHILLNPDGWTLDRISVPTSCKRLELPPPDAWLDVYVSYVVHFNKFYVHLPKNKKTETKRIFGLVLPPTTLEDLHKDMNSPATCAAYKPLELMPSVGELVAALYRDEHWYRARVLSHSRADQNVEVKYIDYGNVGWVNEDGIRILEPKYQQLPAQAVLCTLAGVVGKPTHDSRQMLAAKNALLQLINEKIVKAHVIACEYDELVVELFDAEGFSVAHDLSSKQFVKLEPYTVVWDQPGKPKIIVP